MKPAHKLMDRLKGLRFRTKILLSNVIIIIFLAGSIGGFAEYASIRYIEQNASDLSRQVTHQVAAGIESRAKDLFGSTVYLISDPVIRQLLSETAEAVTADNYPVFRSRMEYLLAPYGTGNPYIDSIAIESRTGYVYWWDRKEPGKGLNTESAEQETRAARRLLERRGTNEEWTASFGRKEDIALVRYFINADKVNENLGVIVINVDARYFRSIAMDNSLVRWENIAIVTERGDVLMPGGNEDIAGLLSSGELQRLGDGAAVSSSVERAGRGRYLLTSALTGNLGWRVLCFIPLGQLMGTTRLLAAVIGVVCLEAIAISTGIAVLLSNSMARNIKILEQTMRKVEEGDFHVRAAPLGRDEVGMLSVRFNYMVTRINELIVVAYEERMAKQRAEFQTLLARINPHFLYNTLGTIRWYSRMRRQPDIEMMVSSLIDLLKASLRRSGEFQPLGQELDDLASYIHLQKIGYGDAFEVVYRVDEPLRSCYVPFFTLQPLVENAILHGLEISKGGGSIVIEASREAGELVVVVADNGVGMDAGTMDAILRDGGRGSTTQGLNSIGVRSIHERIRLYYGGRYGLEYDSAPGQGTQAIVRLPYITDAEEVRRYAAGDDRGG